MAFQNHWFAYALVFVAEVDCYFQSLGIDKRRERHIRSGTCFRNDWYADRFFCLREGRASVGFVCKHAVGLARFARHAFEDPSGAFKERGIEQGLVYFFLMLLFSCARTGVHVVVHERDLMMPSPAELGVQRLLWDFGEPKRRLLLRFEGGDYFCFGSPFFPH